MTGMKVERIREGVTTNPQTGESHVPNADGTTHTETMGEGSPGFLFGEDTPAVRHLLSELIKRNALEAEAAAARGQKFNPTMGSRAKSVVSSNITPLKLVGFVVVGGVTYWLGKKALNFLARKMGWNLFGNVVETEEEMYAGGTKDFDERKAPRTRRPSIPATQPQATA